MKNKEEINRVIDENNIQVLRENFSGFFGRFKRGKFCGMTICCTWAQGWEHVSIDGKSRTPTWEEMCYIKDMFWNEDETVVQYHPCKKDYVNVAKYCLHLWKPIESYSGTLVTPPKKLVY